MTHRAQTYLRKLRKNEISGAAFCEAYSRLMDKDIKALAKQEGLPESVALIATGGYGRAELCPASDIDILFLTPHKTTAELERKIEAVLYKLWDTGIKIGHAVRTVHECLGVMKTDPKVMTSLMDARLIWGDQTLYQSLQKNILSSRKTKTVTQFITAQLTERDKRHTRYEDSRYVLEPNIKDGKGGLRDYQTLFWITGQRQDAQTPRDLQNLKILTPREAKRFEKAHDFLLTVRCHLHDIAKRGEERLHFDIQPELASRLGYTHRNNAKAVERFMKHYFLVTRDIGDMTRIICAAIEDEEESKNKLIKPSTKTLRGFVIKNNRIDFSTKQNLKKTPQIIMQFFKTAQDNALDIHPAALRRLAKNHKIIDKDFITTPSINKTFVNILTTPNAATILRRMNEAGILERFIPEFQKTIALMQFDRYHVFTVDEHTLRAINTLHALENGDLRDEAPLAGALIQTIKHKKALYVAMLLHDICKGRKGDHSILGAELALKLCPRLGLNDEETRLVSWLVFDHLFMSQIAFNRDLEDPQTLEDFLFRIHGLERLKLLTILTTADIMAVGPGRWTAWKDKLISDLYYMTEARMIGKHPLISASNMTSIPFDLEHDETRIDIAQDSERNATIISIYTSDRPALFATLAGALSAAGTNIIEARINTREDGRIADIFTVQNLSSKPILSAKRLKDIETAIHSALDGNLNIKQTLKKHVKTPAKKDIAFTIPKGVTIRNNASRNHTVIEAYGRDRTGILYDLAHVISKQKHVIKSAKINTLGLRVTDIFYIQNKQGKKITNKGDLDKLQNALLRKLSS